MWYYRDAPFGRDPWSSPPNSGMLEVTWKDGALWENWSIMASVDDLGSDYAVGIEPAIAIEKILQVLPAPNRVVVRQLSEDTVEATTVRHTPAWAFAGLLVPPVGIMMVGFIRKDRTAHLTVRSTSAGTVIRARGSLDTAAANRLRAIRITPSSG